MAVLVTLIVLAFAFAAADAGAAKAPTAKSSLKSLARQASSLPPAAASAAKRRTLKRLAGHARRSARRRPCASVKDLNNFRRVVVTVPVKAKYKSRQRRRAAKRLSALGPASVEASRLLLASKRTKRCGGGVKPPKGDNPKFKVLKNSARQLRVRVQLPAVQFVAREGDGQAWTQLVLQNFPGAPGAAGTPGIPTVSDVLAVPDGAKIQLKTNDVDKVVVDGVDVFPVQPDPVDEDTPPPNFLKGPFAQGPFQVNDKAYAKDALVPAKPADADSLGTMRDLNIGALQIPTAQYNPDSKKLVLLKSVDVTLKFVGGPHTFSDALSDPWELFQRRLTESMLNARLFGRIDFREILRRCGEEMVVITNPSTIAAANTFATARRAAGIRTNVFQTGGGPGLAGTTPAEIQAFIRDRVNNNLLCIRPSYVTIMGDDDLVPTFTDGPSGIPSDLKYSLKNAVDELPDLAVGRIIGNDQAAVGTAVNKIISYENSPPGGAWLHRAAVAAQFQDDDNDGTENRTFITMAETVRNGLVGHGETVDRVYGESPGNNPQKFQDGTALPAELKKPTFGWNGTGAQVTAAWNQGRFLMVHRDHGWSDGWGTPGYGTADVQGLTNGAMLPVLMSINCSSAAYDYDETSFVGEALVKANGGAVGAFGDTRDSPSTANTQISLGFADALLPFILPSEGPALRQRTGNALIHGKLRLNGIAPLPDGTTRSEFYLWHYFGDPTMQMWGARDPLVINPNLFTAVFKETIGPPPPDPPPYWVQVTLPPEFNGQAFSLLRQGVVIGKGIAAGGNVNIPASFADSPGTAGELEVALEADGYLPVKIPVNDEPPLTTSLSENCPADNQFNSNDLVTITGNLAGAPAGSTVDVTWVTPIRNEPGGRTVVTHPTTDAQGNWSTTLQSQSSEWGNWQVSSKYAGGGGYAPSQSGTCTFFVEDNS
jgi:peptidase C25-like protein